MVDILFFFYLRRKSGNSIFESGKRDKGPKIGNFQFPGGISHVCGYNFAIFKYFFMKLSNYIAYDNMPMIMPNSSDQGHI
jgi:hypothetical protein